MIQYIVNYLSKHVQDSSSENVSPAESKEPSPKQNVGQHRSSAALDQFYTNPEIAEFCLDKFLGVLDFDGFDIILEPSAGSGAFFNLLPSLKKIGIDLEPKADGIVCQDFFDFVPEISARYLVIGNPPFGRVSSLAVKFFNKAADFADTIAFIVPRTFKRVSIQNRLDLNFHLELTEDLPSGCFTPKMDAKCCFQIWTKKTSKRTKVMLETKHEDFVFVSKDNAQFALRAYGSNCGTIEETNLGVLAERSWNWIRSTETIPLEELKDRFRKLDYSISQDSVRQDSLGHSDLIFLYQRAYG